MNYRILMMVKLLQVHQILHPVHIKHHDLKSSNTSGTKRPSNIESPTSHQQKRSNSNKERTTTKSTTKTLLI